jgi:hypothetical protein
MSTGRLCRISVSQMNPASMETMWLAGVMGLAMTVVGGLVRKNEGWDMQRMMKEWMTGKV